MTSPVRAEARLAAAPRSARRKTALTLGFQLRAILPVIIYGALLVALTSLFVWVPMYRQAIADPSPVIGAILAAQLFRIVLWLAAFLLIAGGIASIYALLRARRIAGPIAELRERLAKLAVGEVEPLALDRGDEFREIEAPFNAVVSRLEHMTRNDLEMLRLLRRNLEGISQRQANQQLNDADLKESLAVLLRDVDAEIKKLQMKA